MKRSLRLRSKLRAPALTAALAAMVLTASVAISPAAAEEAPPDHVLSEGCTEVVNFTTVPVSRVDPYVPDDYVFTTFPATNVGPSGGGVLPVTDLILRTFHCDTQTVGDSTRNNTTSVVFGPQVVHDGKGRFAPNMGFYTMFWITDNPDVVHWFRRGSAMPQVHYVPELRFTMEEIVKDVSSVEIAAPKPWPFKVSAVFEDLPDGATLGISSDIHWWGPVPGHRTLYFKNALDNFHFRQAEGTLTVEPGTPMADMYGPHTPHGYFLGAEFARQVTTKAFTEPAKVP